MEKIISIIKYLNFERHWKVFVVNMLLMCLLVILQNLGIKGPDFGGMQALTQPVSNIEKIDVFKTIEEKIKQSSLNPTLQLKRETSLIPEVSAGSEFENANAYIVVDLASGEVLAEHNAKEKVRIASVTKIMTAVTALDLASKDEEFTITSKAAKQIPTKIGVVEGQKMTLEELLNALLLTSANDAAEAIEDGIDAKYGKDVFLRAMNEKAKALGLSQSTFSNPQGFDTRNHYSSAEDIAILTDYALDSYPLFKEIVQKDYQFLAENSDHKQFDLYNWNGLLGVYPGVYGVKIGNTEEAGKTTVVVSERVGKNILVVLFGAPGIIERDSWAAELLDLGFSKAANLPPVNVTEEQLLEKYATWEYFE